MATYSVWVGGVEVNDYKLTKHNAEALAQEFKDDGYDDVFIKENN
jgi:hypothetical protein